MHEMDDEPSVIQHSPDPAVFSVMVKGKELFFFEEEGQVLFQSFQLRVGVRAYQKKEICDGGAVFWAQEKDVLAFFLIGQSRRVNRQFSEVGHALQSLLRRSRSLRRSSSLKRMFSMAMEMR